MLNGTEPASRLLAVVLALDGATLLPSKDGFTLDIIGFKILNVISLADGLNQRAHLIWELRDKDHGLEVRGDSTFGCCHPGETVRADLSGHLRYSQRWSGVCAGVLLGAQGAVRRGENRGRL